MTKSEVKALQELLNEKGAGLVVDGVYGPLTDAAANKHFNYKHQLPTPLTKAHAPWVEEGLLWVGLKEIKGKFHNPKILDWWRLSHLAFKDDETPWCAGYVGGTLETRGYRSSRSGAARSYASGWGTKLKGPAVDSIVVFWRGNPKGFQGHVGYVLGKDKWGNLIVLSANVDDMVKIKPFATNRVIGYYWPKDTTLEPNYDLPILHSDGRVSTNEA